MNEESNEESARLYAEVEQRKAAAVCIYCKKVGCVVWLKNDPDKETDLRAAETYARAPDSHARQVFLQARLLEEADEETSLVRETVPPHGVCHDCLKIEKTMNAAHEEATRILLMTASLDAGATIATMSFLAHLICHGTENLDSLQDRLATSKPLFHVLFPVLPPPRPLNPTLTRAGFDLAVAHALAAMLVQHEMPVACMTIMLVLHAKGYESGENLETLQEALRCGETDFISVKKMIAEAQKARKDG